MSNPHQVTKDFEREVAAYAGAPYCVAVNSCTAAILLAVQWCRRTARFYNVEVEIPRRTYVSVPMSIRHAGARVRFRDEDWKGCYQLAPLPVYDSARYFSSGMYEKGTYQCVSFHASKTLGLEQGGAILHDNREADEWFRRMRFDGRTEGVPPKDDDFRELGWHCYLNPSTAAQGLLKLHSLPRHNEPLPNDHYPDLSQFKVLHG
jgi:dTDP-4-amino-4,6-dideoxygalactose transaminase